MADSEKAEPMSDDAIENIVRMVEAAELLSKSLECSCAKAARIMLKSFQVMAKIQNGTSDTTLLQMLSRAKGVQ